MTIETNYSSSGRKISRRSLSVKKAHKKRNSPPLGSCKKVLAIRFSFENQLFTTFGLELFLYKKMYFLLYGQKRNWLQAWEMLLMTTNNEKVQQFRQLLMHSVFSWAALSVVVTGNRCSNPIGCCLVSQLQPCSLSSLAVCPLLDHFLVSAPSPTALPKVRWFFQVCCAYYSLIAYQSLQLIDWYWYWSLTVSGSDSPLPLHTSTRELAAIGLASFLNSNISSLWNRQKTKWLKLHS